MKKFLMLALAVMLIAVNPIMAQTTVTATANSTLNGKEAGNAALGSASYSGNINWPSTCNNLTNGTGAGQVQKLYVDSNVVAASGADTFDLSGGLTGALNQSVVFTKLKIVAVQAIAGNTNNVIFGYTGTRVTGLGDSIPVFPGGTLMLGGCNTTGYAVTNNTADTLIIRNSGAGSTVTYKIMLWETKAMGTLFGRLKSIDPRDRAYSLRSLVALDVPVRTRPWSAPPCLDQGPTSSCTGHAGAHFLAAAPHLHVVTETTALQLYDAARQNDEWPGEDYEGSSVRGLMKGMMKLGLITGAYLWAWDAETVRDYVLRYGPIVTGTDWYRDMMDPDSHGYLRPVGPIEGGHAWTILGYSASRAAFRMQNSWGLGWGDRGRAWIKFDDYHFLLARDGGEAVSPVEVIRY